MGAMQTSSCNYKRIIPLIHSISTATFQKAFSLWKCFISINTDQLVASAEKNSISWGPALSLAEPPKKN